MLDRVERTTLQEQVYSRLKIGLMSGQFDPGEAVTLKRLASDLGTSIMPVRDALRRLTADGAFEAEPHRSIRVPVMSRQRFFELSETRALIEGHAASLAAERISPEELDAARTANLNMAEALKPGDTPTVTAENQRFHFIIYRAARNDTILPIIESLWLQAGPYIVSLHRKTTARPDIGPRWNNHAMGCHDAMVAALEARDPERAAQAVAEDIRHAASHYDAALAGGNGG